MLSQKQPTSGLNIVYPPDQAQTTSDRIFVIGNVAGDGELRLNGRPVNRSQTGNFAPSIPLAMGSNRLSLRYQGTGKTLSANLQVERVPAYPLPPTSLGFNLLYPPESITRQLGENVCLRAIATPGSEVQVVVGSQAIPLPAQPNYLQLPPNAAVLTASNQSIPTPGNYQGCGTFAQAIADQPVIYQIRQNAQKISQTAPGKITIAPPSTIAVITLEQAIARTGPGSDYSRLTPLPQGTQALVTGREGNWLRLDYGGWVERQAVRLSQGNTVPQSLVRSLSTRTKPGWTELVIPLQVPVPISISQSDRYFDLTLYNVTAQTDTILANGDPIVQRLDWQQIAPYQVRYRLTLKSNQQWGYQVRYQGNDLILALRHPPQNLNSTTILLDPGHGSKADLGARGGTGYPEKDATLSLAKLLAPELQSQGIKVIFTRTGDQDILPSDRAQQIERLQPTLALSLHYNALPDQGDPENTAGIGMFWYHSQSHGLAQYLHDYLTTKLQRPSYGVFWNNLALTRPTVAPSVLLELGFMTHPQEFEWIIDPKAQAQLAKTLAAAVVDWLKVAIN
ncbi:MAG: N-acetylmuramoyl-L-alanine amidase [Pseudanabaenaceae cyanobacterium bins.68]|nr:N-acetylmuramoyl-L-alanine amidase [Pseudanabaenaceae cyanobacterium bins.68]